jgi:putative ABC transport system permease protein
MFRMERRQWSFVVLLIALTVAVGIFIVTAAFNVDGDATLRLQGNATHLIFGPAEVLDDVESRAKDMSQVADVVRLAEIYPIGSATPVTIKSLDPEGLNVAPLIALVEGRYPTDPLELAATSQELSRLGVGVGDTVDLGGEAYSIVGIVENPQVLDDTFFLVPPGLDEFDGFELYVTGTDQQVDQLSQSTPGLGLVTASFEPTATTVVLAALVVGALFEVALLSISVLTVLAQRRVRQLGVLAAIGAGQRQVRAAVVAGGVTAGAVAAISGAALGMGASRLVVPSLDEFAGRRINNVDFPWLIIGGLVLVAFVSAVFAAWWPARKLASMTVAGSLRARRPVEVRPVKMTIAGGVLVAAGVAAMLGVFSIRPADRPIYVDVAALVAVPVGAVLLTPAALRMWVRFAPKRSLEGRVALRDVRRYQSRSAATSASLVIILAIPVIAAVGFHTVERSPTNVATMPENMAIVAARVGDPEPIGFASGLASDVEVQGSGPVEGGGEGDLASLADEVEAIAGDVGARAITLIQPYQRVDGTVVGATVPGAIDDPDVREIERPLLAGIIDDRQEDEPSIFSIELVPTYVASPELVEVLDLEMSDLDGHDVVTNRRGEYVIINERDGEPVPDTRLSVDVVLFDRFTETPGALLAPDYISAQVYTTRVTGWLLVAEEALADEERAQLVDAVGAIGLGVGFHEPGLRGGAIVTWLIVVAALLATGIAAIVSALHRAETSEVDVAYQSVGAPASFRRRVHGITIATLVFVAALLAVGSGLLSQVAFAAEQLGVADLWQMIPLVPLLAVLVLIPLAAFAVSWLGVPAERDAALPQSQFT